MIFATIEWIDPTSKDTCRVLSMLDGSHVFDVIDGDGFVIRREPHLSYTYALTCAAEWRREHGMLDTPLAA